MWLMQSTGKACASESPLGLVFQLTDKVVYESGVTTLESEYTDKFSLLRVKARGEFGQYLCVN